jgi:hypothetical protein
MRPSQFHGPPNNLCFLIFPSILLNLRLDMTGCRSFSAPSSGLGCSSSQCSPRLPAGPHPTPSPHSPLPHTSLLSLARWVRSSREKLRYNVAPLDPSPCCSGRGEDKGADMEVLMGGANFAGNQPKMRHFLENQSKF